MGPLFKYIGVGDKFEKLLELPDRPKTEKGKRLAYIAADVTVIALAVIAFFVIGGASALAAPTFSTLMLVAGCTVVAGIGLAWLAMDIVGKKNGKFARGLAKVMAVAYPLLLAGSALTLMSVGGAGHLQFGIGDFISFCPTTPYFYAGVILLPLSLYLFIDHSLKVLKSKAPPRLPKQSIEMTEFKKRPSSDYRGNLNQEKLKKEQEKEEEVAL